MALRATYFLSVIYGDPVYIYASRIACLYLAVVETIEDDLKDGADDHGYGGGDDEGVGGGEGGLLLLLGPDGAGQQLVPRLYLGIYTETELEMSIISYRLDFTCL